MKKLKTIEICDLSIIKVNALQGKNIIDTGRECIALANLLKVAVDLYFNDHVIRIYTTTLIEDIIKGTSSEGSVKDNNKIVTTSEPDITFCPPSIKEKKPSSLTTDRNDPKLKEGQKNETGQHEIYLVLSEEERAKGFIRPVRNSYVHVGKKMLGLEIHRMIDEKEKKEQKEKYPNDKDYVAVLTVMKKEDGSFLGGTYVTQKELDAWKSGKLMGGCGTLTTMGKDLSETYARDPKFYGATFCCGCNVHLPVEEFIWDGTNEKVGS